MELESEECSGGGKEDGAKERQDYCVEYEPRSHEEDDRVEATHVHAHHRLPPLDRSSQSRASALTAAHSHPQVVAFDEALEEAPQLSPSTRLSHDCMRSRKTPQTTRQRGSEAAALARGRSRSPHTTSGDDRRQKSANMLLLLLPPLLPRALR